MRDESGAALDKSTDDLSPESNNEVTVVSLDKLIIGQEYDVLDASKRWCEAEVQKIDRKAGSVFVTYVYWDSQFDEWISNVEERFCPLHTHTYTENGRLKLGQRIEVLDERQVWLEAFVVDDYDYETDLKVKVHYKGYHAKFDEWILRTDAPMRVRPYGRHKVLRKKQSAFSHSMRPLQTQKQWKVPGTSRRPPSAGSAQMENIPGRQSREHKDSSRIRMPGGELPRINQSNVEIVNDQNQTNVSNLTQSNNNQNYNENDNIREDGDSRTRRITSLSAEYVQYLEALARRNLRVVSVEGDGNCLFRAVAHQIYGNEELHAIVRQKCVDYMESEADFFSQFVEGGKDMFPLYLRAKRMDACWGDDPEIEAICELYDRRAEIWAFDAAQGARKLRTFHETSLQGFQRDFADTVGHTSSSGSARTASSSSARATQQQHREGAVIRLSYYGGGHYDSVIDPAHAANVLHKTPGELEDAHIARTKERRMSRTASAGVLPPIHSSREALAEAQRISDTEATERATMEQVLRESRDAYIRSGYEDLETCLALSIQGRQFSQKGTILKEDPIDDSNLLKVGGAVEAEQEILRTVQEQSERDYYESAIISSIAADGKEDDSVLTEAELLNIAKRESEREALEREARFMGSNAGNSEGRFASPVHQSSSSSNTNNVVRSPAPAASSSFSREEGKGPHYGHNSLTEDATTQHALELAHLSEEEALEMALLQSLVGTVATSSSSTAPLPKGGSSSKSQPSAPCTAVQDEGFHTEEELLEMAMNASLQGYSVTNNAASRSPASGPATGYAINIGAPYVNVHGGGDYSEDMDEELMRAIEESLRK